MVDDEYYGSGDRQLDTDRYGSNDPHDMQHGERPRGWGCVSWIAILALVGFLVALRDSGAAPEGKLQPLDDSPASMQGLMELQVRMRIGFGELLRRIQPGSDAEVKALFEGSEKDPAEQANLAASWGSGTFGQRVQYAIAGGELSGPPAALKLLGKLKWDWEAAQLKPSADQIAVYENLRKLYFDYRKKKFDAPSVPAPERQLLIKKLGWYGRLALTPPDAPDQVARKELMQGPLNFVYAIFAIFFTVLGLGAIGTIGLIVFIVATSTGSLQMGLRQGSGSSGVYAETFALWLIAFTAGLFAIELWPFEEHRFLLNLGVMFGSLGVLLWPVIRGIPFEDVCRDLGLTWGRAGILEPVMGIPSYVMMLPMLAVGFTLTFILLVVVATNGGGAAQPVSPFEARDMLSHPIVNVVLQGGLWIRIQLLLLACVAAPIVEEIMFRGVLYRHLRDASSGLGWLLSCVVSALWTSFIFAVIHPQGMIAVPALMGIACGCTLAREWRDSLWASIVVHSISNSLIFTVLMLAVS